MEMDDYWKARNRRYNAVSENLMKLAQKLKDMGYTVQCFKSDTRPVHFRVVRGECYCGFGFAEVPYRWWYGSSEHSGKQFGLYRDAQYECPFDVDEIVADITHRVEHFFDSIYRDI